MIKKNRTKIFAWFILLIICIAYGIFYFNQRALLYHPSHHNPSIDEYHAHDMQLVSFKNKDGIHLNGWYKKAEKDNPTLIYFHGNAGQFGSRYPKVKRYIKAGLGVLLFSYRGFSGNQGNPSEQGLYQDALAAVEFLKQKNINCLVYYGESLGTGVAVQTALTYPPKAIILQSPYTSITAAARYHYPWNIVPPWDKYESINKIANLKNVPILVAHGAKDKTVPVEQGIALYNKAKQPKKLIVYPQKGHGDIADKALTTQVLKFLRSVKC